MLEDWGHCAARQRLAAELAARDVHLYHASEEETSCAEGDTVTRIDSMTSSYLFIPIFPRNIGWWWWWRRRRRRRRQWLLINYYWLLLIMQLCKHDMIHMQDHANNFSLNKLFSSAHFVMALEDQLPLTPAKAAKARADRQNCLLMGVAFRFPIHFWKSKWLKDNSKNHSHWLSEMLEVFRMPLEALPQHPLAKPRKKRGLWRSLHQCTSSTNEVPSWYWSTWSTSFEHLWLLQIFVQTRCLHEWMYICGKRCRSCLSAHIFSLFCCTLKEPSGVTEGSPCALASTAPDTVFEALEEAATLFAQQRQKVVVWWFVSVWWWSLEKTNPAGRDKNCEDHCIQWKLFFSDWLLMMNAWSHSLWCDTVSPNQFWSFGVEAIEPQRLKSFQCDSVRFDAASEFLNDLEHVLT